MQQFVQLGKPASVPNVLDLVQQLAQREADEIRRLKQALSVRSQH